MDDLVFNDDAQATRVKFSTLRGDVVVRLTGQLDSARVTVAEAEQLHDWLSRFIYQEKSRYLAAS